MDESRESFKSILDISPREFCVSNCWNIKKKKKEKQKSKSTLVSNFSK